MSVIDRIAGFKYLEEACLELARGFIEAALEKLDQALAKEKPPGYRVAGFRTRVLSTRIGDIRLRRRLYVKATGRKGRGRGRFLLDESLNLAPRRRMAGGLLQLAVSLSTRLPFREVSAVLSEAGMPSISHATIHQEVRRYGKELAELQERLALGQAEEPAKKCKVPIIFLEVDGVVVKRQKSSRRRLEIKLGVAYEGWQEEAPNGSRRRLVRPWVFAGVYESVEAFWEALLGELERRYEIDDNTVIVVNGDGAEWIQKTGQEHLPHAIIQLDRFHLRRMVRQVLGAKAEQKLWGLLLNGDDQAYLETIEALVTQARSEGEKQERIKLLAFLKLYREHLLDYRYRLKDGIKQWCSELNGVKLYGLGVAETVVDKKIANRMKKRGMAWSIEGAKAMAAFLVSRGNNRLHEALMRVYGPEVMNPLSVKEFVVEDSKQASEDPASWLRCHVKALDGPFEGPWTRVLRDIVSPAWSVV